MMVAQYAGKKEMQSEPACEELRCFGVGPGVQRRAGRAVRYGFRYPRGPVLTLARFEMRTTAWEKNMTICQHRSCHRDISRGGVEALLTKIRRSTAVLGDNIFELDL